MPTSSPASTSPPARDAADGVAEVMLHHLKGTLAAFESVEGGLERQG